jgi:hypothetical protein
MISWKCEVSLFRAVSAGAIPGSGARSHVDSLPVGGKLRPERWNPPKNMPQNSFVSRNFSAQSVEFQLGALMGLSAGKRMYRGVCANTLTSVNIQSWRSIACTATKISKY